MKTALYQRARNIARSFIGKDDRSPRLSYYSGTFRGFLTLVLRLDLTDQEDLLLMAREFHPLDMEILKYLQLVKKSRKPSRKKKTSLKGV